MNSPFIITTIKIDGEYTSIFDEKAFSKIERSGMVLTDRISALNFRLRESAAGYATDWHVAGDPTLIIVQQGTIRIILRNGDFKDFSKGMMFIAEDYLPESIAFDNTRHGHKAEVLGSKTFKAVHIKLDSKAVE